MDIKKAIERLKNISDNYIYYNLAAGNSEDIDLAISALEKQIPKKPLESDYGDYQCPQCLENSLFTTPGYQDYDYCANCGQRISWSEVENSDIVGDLLNIFNEQACKWIPVAERLPNRETGCLVWQKIDGHYKYNIWHYVTDFPSNVIAWQPLPEPYKEQL